MPGFDVLGECIQSTLGSSGPSAAILSDSVHIYTTYDPADLPPVPGPGWTRFVCVSDTHCHKFEVPDGDVLLHGGDLTGWGKLHEFEKAVDWLKELPHRSKIIIAGNHDMCLDMTICQELEEGDEAEKLHRKAHDILTSESARSSGIHYLEDERYELQAKEGGRIWSIWGSPWSVWFGGMGFNYREDKAEDIVSIIPPTDILLTHGPPRGMHDRTTRGEYVGCPSLTQRLSTIRPRLHVFGHIHEARGATLYEWNTVAAMTTFVNPANVPLGPLMPEEKELLGESSRFGKRKAGGPGWRAIVVDLLD